MFRTLSNWWAGSFDASIIISLPYSVNNPITGHNENISNTLNRYFFREKKNIVFGRPVQFTDEEKEEINEWAREKRIEIITPAGVDQNFLNNIEPPIIFTDENKVFTEDNIHMENFVNYSSLQRGTPPKRTYLIHVHWNLGQGDVNRYVAGKIMEIGLRYAWTRERSPYIIPPGITVTMPSVPTVIEERRINPGTENAITANVIRNGNIMTNLKTTNTKWESDFDRYYKRSTYNSLPTPKTHPFTKNQLRYNKIKSYVARIPVTTASRTRRGSTVRGGARTRRR